MDDLFHLNRRCGKSEGGITDLLGVQGFCQCSKSGEVKNNWRQKWWKMRGENAMN